jgi:hypothetical protein
MALLPIINLPKNRKIYKVRRKTLPDDFKTLYRFEEQNLEWISEHFLGETTETRGGALTCKQQMQVFLRYVSDPGFQSGVAEDLGIDQTTVSKTFHKGSRGSYTYNIIA